MILVLALKQMSRAREILLYCGGGRGRREIVRSLTPPASLIIVFFVVIFVMRMIAANETLALCIQLGANHSARVLVVIHVHIRVTRTDSTQQLRKFASGNSLTVGPMTFAAVVTPFNSPDVVHGHAGICYCAQLGDRMDNRINEYLCRTNQKSLVGSSKSLSGHKRVDKRVVRVILDSL